MSSDSREPAFDWGESDDGLALGEETREKSTKPERVRTDNPVMLAVCGGLYAVWSVAWVLGIAAAPAQQAGSLIDAIMFQFGEFLGMVATPLWFGVVWWLTSGSHSALRLSLLVVGLLLLLPLPLILPVLAS